jgi:tetratricopeptide (TPR) repeat protein
MNETLVQRAFQSNDPVIAEQAFNEYDAQIQQSSDPNQKAQLFLGKAVLYGFFLRFVDARKSVELASAQNPDDFDLLVQVDYIQASLYDQEGNSQDALEYLTAVLFKHRERLMQADLRFMYEDIQLRRGLAATALRKFDYAAPLLLEVQGFDLSLKDRTNVLSSLGLCYSELGDYERAKDYFLAACKIGLRKEWEGEVHMRLAIAYAHLKCFTEAKHEFKLCEKNFLDYHLDIKKIYGWLSWVCKGLGENLESEEYARFSRPS